MHDDHALRIVPKIARDMSKDYASCECESVAWVTDQLDIMDDAP